MPDKSTRERLKRQAAEQKGIVGPVVAPGAATVNVIVPDIRMNGFEMAQITIEAKKPKKGPTPKKLKKPQPPQFRLPDGAEFSATYNASAKRWKATLTIGDYVDREEQSGIHCAIHQLGHRWAEKHQKELDAAKQAG